MEAYSVDRSMRLSESEFGICRRMFAVSAKVMTVQSNEQIGGNDL
jgi:hypothetical protein